MPIDDHSRRGFLVGAGLVAGSLVGDAVLPGTAEAQTRPSGSSQAPSSKGARFRAALAAGKPMIAGTSKTASAVIKR